METLYFMDIVVFTLALAGLLISVGVNHIFINTDSPFIAKFTCSVVLAVVALPLIMAMLVCLAITFTPQRYRFDIHNYSGHKIVLKEARVGRKVIFKGEQILAGRSDIPPLSYKKYSDTFISLKGDFVFKPGKIRLLVYDTKLGKERWWKVWLPDYPKHPACEFNIVYDQEEGFRYEDRPCG